MAKTVVWPDLFDALKGAGLADDDTRRVVIDIKAGDIPVVYVEKYGDKSLINVVEALTSVEIERK
jgi:hypothetical protein